MDQVAVPGNSRRHAAAAHGPVEGLLDALEGEVRVTLVLHLEVGDLWVDREVLVLGPLGNDLHESTRHNSQKYERSRRLK